MSDGVRLRLVGEALVFGVFDDCVASVAALAIAFFELAPYGVGDGFAVAFAGLVVV